MVAVLGTPSRRILLSADSIHREALDDCNDSALAHWTHRNGRLSPSDVAASRQPLTELRLEDETYLRSPVSRLLLSVIIMSIIDAGAALWPSPDRPPEILLKHGPPCETRVGIDIVSRLVMVYRLR